MKGTLEIASVTKSASSLTVIVKTTSSRSYKDIVKIYLITNKATKPTY